MAQTDKVNRIVQSNGNYIVSGVTYDSATDTETPFQYTFTSTQMTRYGLQELLDGMGNSGGGSTTFTGGAITGDTSLVSTTASKTFKLQSSASGGLGTSTGDTDTTGHIVSESFQTNGPQGGSNSGFFGEGIRMALKTNLAKNMIAWTLLRDSTNTPAGKSAYFGTDRSVVWTGAHYYAQDQPDPQNPTVIHGHHSFAEIPDANDALQTRFEINFIDKSTGKVGVDRTNIMTNFSDFTVRAGTSATGSTTDAGVLRISGGNTWNKDLEWNINDNPNSGGFRWRIRVDNTTDGYNGTGSGSDFRIMRRDSIGNNNETTVLFAERLTGNVLIGNSALTDSSTNQGRLNIHWAGGSTNGITITPTAAMGGSSSFIKNIAASSSTEVVFENRIATDTVSRFKMTVAGTMTFGPGGSAGRDWTIARTNVAEGTVTGDLIVTGKLSGGVKPGLAVPSGGASQWGIPGSFFNAQGTSAFSANAVRYVPIIVRYPITITALQFEVTAAPATNANVSVGIYAANASMQPTGAPLYDSGSIAVAAAFTGIKTTTGLSVVLPAGSYLVAQNTDTALTVRTLATPTTIIANAMGTTSLIQRFDGSQTYGAYPTPGTQWTTANASAGGLQNTVVFQWTE